MSQMTPLQARLINPITTAIARGYNHVFAPVAQLLFPIVPVLQRGGKVVEFSQDDFRLISTGRAPGQNTKRVSFGHAGSDYTLADHSLEARVTVEEAGEASSVGIDLISRSIRGVQRIIDVERENQSAVLATTPANYAAGSKLEITVNASRYDDPTSDPLGNIAAAREAIRSKIGVYPTTMILGPLVASALKIHPDVLAALKDTDLKKATIADLALIFEVPNIVVGEGTYWNGTSFVDIWGKNIVLAYTQPATLADGGSPAYGYTYQLEGMPFVEPEYYDNNTKSWYYPLTDVRKPVIAGAIAGYLITGAVQ